MRRSRSGSAATAALTSRKRRMVRFISSIVPASSSTSFTTDATWTGRENSKRRIAFASPTSARIGRATALAASKASTSAAARTMAVVSIESRAIARASVSNSSSGAANTSRGASATPLRGSGATSVRQTRPPTSRLAVCGFARGGDAAGERGEDRRAELRERHLHRCFACGAGPERARGVRMRGDASGRAHDRDLGAGRDALASERVGDRAQRDVRADDRVGAGPPARQRDAHLVGGEEDVRRDLDLVVGARRGAIPGPFARVEPGIVGAGLGGEARETGVEPDEGARPARAALDALHEIRCAVWRAELLPPVGRIGHAADEEEVAVRVAGVERGEVRRHRERLAQQRQRAEAFVEGPGGGDPRLREDVDQRLARRHDLPHLVRRLARDAVEEVVGRTREHRDAAVVGETADREPGDEQQRDEEGGDVDGERIPPA